jgi:hypothetical protein
MEAPFSTSVGSQGASGTHRGLREFMYMSHMSVIIYSMPRMSHVLVMFFGGAVGASALHRAIACLVSYAQRIVCPFASLFNSLLVS